MRVWLIAGGGCIRDGSDAGSARCVWVHPVSPGFNPLLCYGRLLRSLSDNRRRGGQSTLYWIFSAHTGYY